MDKARLRAALDSQGAYHSSSGPAYRGEVLVYHRSELWPGWPAYIRGEPTDRSRASPQTLRDMRRDSTGVPNRALRSKSGGEGQHVRRQRQ